VPDTTLPREAAEELRLWADYYEARARVLEIMRREGTGATLAEILDQDTLAHRALARIKKIRGMR
jgi:hypothetical protein